MVFSRLFPRAKLVATPRNLEVGNRMNGRLVRQPCWSTHVRVIPISKILIVGGCSHELRSWEAVTTRPLISPLGVSRSPFVLALLHHCPNHWKFFTIKIYRHCVIALGKVAQIKAVRSGFYRKDGATLHIKQ